MAAKCLKLMFVFSRLGVIGVFAYLDVRCSSFSTARFTRDAEFAERKYVFFSGERPEKKRSYSVMAAKIAATHIKTRL